MKSLLLLLLLGSAGVAQVGKEPKLVGHMLCQKVKPPANAPPGTTTLSCHHEATRNLDELQPITLQIPETFARFVGSNFLMDVFDNGKQRFSENQPKGSEIQYAPPCPKREFKRPLQAPPCNPELKPE